MHFNKLSLAISTAPGREMKTKYWVDTISEILAMGCPYGDN
jgi:hypothetical protein